MSGSALLTATGLQVRIGGRLLVRQLDLTVRAGERWVLLGPNGSGKTRLLETLLGLHPPAAGTLAYGDLALTQLSLREAARRRAFLPQTSVDAFDGRVYERVLAARHPWRTGSAAAGPADHASVATALAAVQLQDLAARRLATLSGGERQRVALATVLAQEAPLLLLDEPLNHLDLARQLALLAHLEHVTQAGAAVVCSLHDLNQAAAFASHVVLLQADGEVQAGPATHCLTATALGATFGVALQRVLVDGQACFMPLRAAGDAP